MLLYASLISLSLGFLTHLPVSEWIYSDGEKDNDNDDEEDYVYDDYDDGDDDMEED